MKLNKTELTALAGRIRSDLQSAANKEQEILNVKCDADNIKAATAIKKAIDGLDSKTKKYMVGIYGQSDFNCLVDKKIILHRMRKKQTKVNVPGNQWNGPSEIFNDLVIAQIDSENLGDLIKKVTEKYTK